MLDVPQALLDERRARGADRWDEMWDGELHMVEGAASLVVEILSPDDETYRKLVWYASVGVGEVLVIEPLTRRVELFANRDGKMVPVEPVVIECLGVRADTIDGKLRLAWEGGTADI